MPSCPKVAGDTVRYLRQRQYAGKRFLSFAILEYNYGLGSVLYI